MIDVEKNLNLERTILSRTLSILGFLQVAKIIGTVKSVVYYLQKNKEIVE